MLSSSQPVYKLSSSVILLSKILVSDVRACRVLILILDKIVSCARVVKTYICQMEKKEKNMDKTTESFAFDCPDRNISDDEEIDQVRYQFHGNFA